MKLELEDIIFYIITTGLIIGIAIILIFGSVQVIKNDEHSLVNTNYTEVEECEHDWVVCSEWSYMRCCYKTVSKCSKCGKVVK